MQNIINNDATNCSDTCLETYEKNMCLRKCKSCKSKVKTSVVDGSANWMQDHGNQQKYFNKHIKVLATLMTYPCKIDARRNNATNIEIDANMVPKWRSESIKNT